MPQEVSDLQARVEKPARKYVLEQFSERIENFDPSTPWNALLVQLATQAAEAYAGAELKRLTAERDQLASDLEDARGDVEGLTQDRDEWKRAAIKFQEKAKEAEAERDRLKEQVRQLLCAYHLAHENPGLTVGTTLAECPFCTRFGALPDQLPEPCQACESGHQPTLMENGHYAHVFSGTITTCNRLPAPPEEGK